MGTAEETADFAALLRELKQRSGLSYEALAKRAHMSTSTLHRYCVGEGVPADYVSVASFARVCRATPEEMVELHRRWVMADAARERARRAAADTAPAAGDPRGVSDAKPQTVPPARHEHTPASEPSAGPTRAPAPVPTTTPHPPSSPTEPIPEGTLLTNRPTAPVGAHLLARRWAVVAASAVAVTAISTAIMVNHRDGRDLAGGRPAGATRASDRQPSPRHASASSSPSPSLSARPSRTSDTAAGTKPSASASATGGAQDTDSVPLTVTTRAHAWQSPPCGVQYLINQPPSKVPQPPAEQDAPGWATALGAIASDGQRVALTVQGTGSDVAVIESMYVRVVRSGPPLAWNVYDMAVGCGGGVETASFDIDLDAEQPTPVPKAGQHGFPYSVSRSDPEVLYVTPHTNGHDVSWYLELQWSSGGRQGTMQIDDHGKPFRTSAMTGRPQYEYPLGATQWSKSSED
ncbi:helix-turn-helix domain-containing protein [Streptomyces sp. NPDC001177]